MKFLSYFGLIILSIIITIWLSLSIFLFIVVSVFGCIILSDDFNAKLFRKVFKLPKTKTYGEANEK